MSDETVAMKNTCQFVSRQKFPIIIFLGGERKERERGGRGRGTPYPFFLRGQKPPPFSLRVGF